MDFRDLRALHPGTVLDADVCIVGTGPAGLTLARELAGSRVKVVLLESGDRDEDAWNDALNATESTGRRRVTDEFAVRNRVLGGTSHTWSGRAAVFDDLDFTHRDWVPNSGWPLDRRLLAPYFARSMPYLGIDVADNTDERTVAARSGTSPSFDASLLRHYSWTYSRDSANPRDSMRFGPDALRVHAPTVQGFLNATVTSIDVDAPGEGVDAVEVTGRDGQRRSVRARFTVLCGGAIENARLLLASNRRIPAGLGNDHDLVGRHLMDHPRGMVGRFRQSDRVAVQRIFGDYRTTVGGETFLSTPGVALSHEVQRAEGLLNCALWTVGIPVEDDPLTSLGRLARREAPVGRNARNVLRGAAMLAEGTKRRIVDHRGPLRDVASLDVVCIVEQVPDPESRVTLADTVDAFGTPIARIHWRSSEQEIATVTRTARAFAAEMRRLGLPAPDLYDLTTEDAYTRAFHDAAHPSGTTRMAACPTDGVVDTDGAVYGVDGLYVAGSSVFPTSGHANPTQMIVALTIRLADHLKAQLHSAAPTGRARARV
ncbi:MAG: hypothetical protein QOG20_6291 [Pseudonocardiales bacterium]|nr:hypothetical protein [Pseudonocardiales bacterium]